MASTVLTARVSGALEQGLAAALAAKPDETQADFFRLAIEHEIQRRRLTKPERPEPTIKDLARRLDQLVEHLAREDTAARQHQAMLQLIAEQNAAIAAAMGVQLPQAA